MPSDSLVEFHKRRFPNGDVQLYSKETFYALVNEINWLEQNNISKEITYEKQKQKSNSRGA